MPQYGRRRHEETMPRAPQGGGDPRSRGQFNEPPFAVVMPLNAEGQALVQHMATELRHRLGGIALGQPHQAVLLAWHEVIREPSQARGQAAYKYAREAFTTEADPYTESTAVGLRLGRLHIVTDYLLSSDKLAEGHRVVVAEVVDPTDPASNRTLPTRLRRLARYCLEGVTLERERARSSRILPAMVPLFELHPNQALTAAETQLSELQADLDAQASRFDLGPYQIIPLANNATPLANFRR